MLSLCPSRTRPRVRGHPRRRRMRVDDLLISDGSVAAREPATAADDSGGGGVGSPRAESPTAADGEGRRWYVSSRNKLSVSPMRFLPQMNPVLLHVADPESCGTVEPPSKGGIVILACVEIQLRQTRRPIEGQSAGAGDIWPRPSGDWIGLVASFPTYRRLYQL